MDKTVDFFGQADKQTEFGDIANFTLDLGTSWIGRAVFFPRIAAALLETKLDPTLRTIDVKNHNFNLLAGRYDLARMNVFLGPTHF